MCKGVSVILVPNKLQLLNNPVAGFVGDNDGDNYVITVMICLINTLKQDKPAAIWQTALSNVFSLIKMFVRLVQIDNKPSLVKIKACHPVGDKLLSKPIMVYIHHSTLMS